MKNDATIAGPGCAVQISTPHRDAAEAGFPEEVLDTVLSTPGVTGATVVIQIFCKTGVACRRGSLGDAPSVACACSYRLRARFTYH